MASPVGRYELLRALARGGMAEIYLARRRSGGIEKLLVIKRIRAERAGDPRFLELFVREARLSMSLTHQNIVQVFDFGRIKDEVFLAMEHVEGKDLGATLARAGTGLPPLFAAFIAAECCRALVYAHQRRREGEHLGVVHRDVTPRNVLLSWSGEVKLTDFGVAALAGDQAGRLVGTPAYMAPEQARGDHVDARADLYAIGLVLREACTGVRARPGTNRDALVDAACRGELAPWPPDAPPGLVAIVERASAAVPAERYADARSMLAALDEYILAERARHPGEPPDRRLADWLAEVWTGERGDDDEQLDMQLDAVSMFDDIGSDTECSFAATADAEVSPQLAPAPVIVKPPIPSTRRRAVMLLGLAGIATLAVGLLLRGSDGNTAGDAAAPVIAVAVPDGAPRQVLDPSASVDASNVVVSPTALDASHLSADAHVSRRPRTATVASASDASIDARVATRKVRINARPWAKFTVDGRAAQYETISTIELPPGPHAIHFWNPETGVQRDVTIVVPDDRDIDHVEDLRHGN